jgi:hypothetical protein
MIYVQDYEETLRKAGNEFFISDFRYVSDLLAWSKQRGIDLSEPSQPAKIITEKGSLTLFCQSEIPEEMLDNVITALSVRWSLKDNVDDPSKRLDSVKKRLLYCLFKECARTDAKLARDELLEDEWAFNTMDKLGFFLE